MFFQRTCFQIRNAIWCYFSSPEESSGYFTNIFSYSQNMEEATLRHSPFYNGAQESEFTLSCLLSPGGISTKSLQQTCVFAVSPGQAAVHIPGRHRAVAVSGSSKLCWAPGKTLPSLLQKVIAAFVQMPPSGFSTQSTCHLLLISIASF